MEGLRPAQLISHGAGFISPACLGEEEQISTEKQLLSGSKAARNDVSLTSALGADFYESVTCSQPGIASAQASKRLFAAAPFRVLLWRGRIEDWQRVGRDLGGGKEG